MLDKIKAFLSGKKTYILSFVGTCLYLAVSAGWIPEDKFPMVVDYADKILLFLIGGTLRAGIKKAP